MKTLLFLFSLLIVSNSIHCQNSLIEIHSHNDYSQSIPFYGSLAVDVRTIEIDLFVDVQLKTLFVAHEYDEINASKTFESLYLIPFESYLSQSISNLNTQKQLPSLMIDFKTPWNQSLPVLIKTLEKYPELQTALKEKRTKLIISGSIPPPENFAEIPKWIMFDGRLNLDYSTDQLKRIYFISSSFSDFSKWNGKGRPIAAEEIKILGARDKANSLGKNIRFWGAPDSPTAWSYFLKNEIQIVNTDHPQKLRIWHEQYSHSWVKETNNVLPIKEKNSDFQLSKGFTKPKNIILMIGDGMGLAHIDAARSVRTGKLNMLQSKNIGLIHTQATDAYSTDSAAGATAYAIGHKTNNRALGINKDNEEYPSLMKLATNLGKRTAIITTDHITSATPAAFYASQKDRSNTDGIISDLVNSSVDALIYSGEANLSSYKSQQTIHFDDFNKWPKQQIQIRETGNTNWQSRYIGSWLDQLSTEKGFFILLEEGRIDNHSHGQNLSSTIETVLAFDKTIESVLKWVEKNPHTLVIVTADHETGGLVIPDGDLDQQSVQGFFYSDDHTGISVPLFAFGIGAELFSGVYENTMVYEKIKLFLDKP